MKKNILCFILGGIIFGTIGVGATYVYTARDISFLPSDENWNVSNASEAISSLKDDLNTVNNNVSEYKNNIAQTLTDNGITTNSNDSFETIDNNIDDGINNYKSQINTCNSNYSTLNTNFTNYKKGVTTALKNKGVNVTESSTLAQVETGINGMSTKAVLIGTYSGNKTINVSSYIKSGDTKDNFIIEVTGWSAVSGSGDNTPPKSGSASGYYASLSANSISKSLSGNNLTISGAVATAQVKSDWGTGWGVSANISYKLYRIDK